MRVFEKPDYKTKLSELIGLWREENLGLIELSLSLSCGSDNLGDGLFACNHEYRGKDIDFKILLRRNAGQHRRCFIGLHNIEVFGILPQLRDEVFVAISL